MTAGQKRLPARFYETAGGRAPVREFLLDLAATDRTTIGKDIAKAEFSWPIGIPACRSLGGGVFEIRSVGGGEMVLLRGFIKKTQTTPKADLDLARKRLKEVE